MCFVSWGLLLKAHINFNKDQHMSPVCHCKGMRTKCERMLFCGRVGMMQQHVPAHIRARASQAKIPLFIRWALQPQAMIRSMKNYMLNLHLRFWTFLMIFALDQSTNHWHLQLVVATKRITMTLWGVWCMIQKDKGDNWQIEADLVNISLSSVKY